MIRKPGIHAIAALAFALLTTAEARSQTFDGITIIELADDAANRAIGGGGELLVAFVSARGTYAAVGSGQGSCVAWAVPGSYTGASIAFGLPAGSHDATIANPRICRPFTLRFEGRNAVRVEAENKTLRDGRPDPDAPVVRYSRKRKMVAQIPLVALNWGLAPFARHDIKGVRLGPLPALTASNRSGLKIEVHKLRSSSSGTYKNFQATIDAGRGEDGPMTVRGRVAAAEVTGWPWDTLIGATYSERLPQRSTRAAFLKAVIERYGQPTLGIDPANPDDNMLFWIYGLDGRQLGPNDTASDNCLSYMKLRGGRVANLMAINSDFGPWECALIMKLHFNSSRSSHPVDGYNIEVVSGYAYAINHFLRRVEEMRQIQEKIGEVKSYQPKL